MTKAAEIALLAEFATKVPRESYLHGFLAHVVPQFDSDTRSDFPCMPDAKSIEHELKELELRLSAKRKEVKEMETKSTDLCRAITNLEIQLAEAKERARAMARSLSFV